MFYVQVCASIIFLMYGSDTHIRTCSAFSCNNRLIINVVTLATETYCLKLAFGKPFHQPGLSNEA